MNIPQGVVVETGASPDFLQRVLTQDISCFECILDLIDNSIDAINVLNNSGAVDHYQLPASYDGFQIFVTINSTHISIEDNGSGILLDAIRHRLLKIGEPSNHQYGIGHFGVGLKRAFAKLGSSVNISTVSNEGAYEVIFNVKEMSDAGTQIYANTAPVNGRSTGTKIKIENITAQAIAELMSGTNSTSQLMTELNIRYNRFLRKGLNIFLNDVEAMAACPEVKEMSPVKIQEDAIVVSEGLTAYIVAGMHEKYFRVDDPQYDSKEIEKLTDEYGWYYVCNDRVVKIATRDQKFGWGPRWHNEYYGFVGWVYFVGEVSTLPWNTKKTDIDPGATTFLKIKDKLTTYADTYRKQNRSLKKGKKTTDTSGTTGTTGMTGTAGVKDATGQPALPFYVPGAPTVGSGSPDDGRDGAFFGEVGIDVPDDAGAEVRATTASGDEKLRYKGPTKIQQSQVVVSKLNELGSKKLCQLYNSLTVLSVIEHPSIIQVGAWSFFESLSRMIFNRPADSFIATFNSEMSANWYKQDKEKKKTISRVLQQISDDGNSVKHDAIFVIYDARHLINSFAVLEDVIIKALDKALELKYAKILGAP